MSERARQLFSFDDYVMVEEMSPIKHAFLHGHGWAMAGATPEHAALAAKVASLLDRQLEGRPCRVFSSDLRVRVKATGLGTYPDVSVVCGRLEMDPDDPKKHTVTTPKVSSCLTRPGASTCGGGWAASGRGPWPRGMASPRWARSRVPSRSTTCIVTTRVRRTRGLGGTNCAGLRRRVRGRHCAATVRSSASTQGVGYCDATARCSPTERPSARCSRDHSASEQAELAAARFQSLRWTATDEKSLHARTRK